MLKNRDIRPDAVAIYIRWSTEEQGEGTTLDVQRERCSLFVRSQGWTVREDLVFVDEGFSGASLDRPAITRLRQAVSDGKVACVVSYRLDRLSRNLVDTVTLVRQEWAGKCIYRSATEGFDTASDSPSGGLIFNILASFAEFERAVIKERTHSGVVRRRQEGLYITGNLPYGYMRAGKGRVEVKPGEDDVVGRIFTMAATNTAMGATTIARKFNEEGIPAPHGGKWWGSVVRGILRNPLYMGNVVYGRRNLPPTVPGGMGRHDADGEPLAETEGAAPAIISRELFEQAHAALQASNQAKPKNSNRARPDYLLSTIAKCRCGGPLQAAPSRHGTMYYRCVHKTNGLGCPDESIAFQGAPIEQKIVAALRERFGSTRREEALQAVRQQLAGDDLAASLMHAAKDVEKRKEKVLSDLARLRRQAREGELKPSTYEEFKADAEAELEGLEKRLRELQVQLATAVEVEVVIERYERILQAVDEWDTLEPGERKEMLRALCKRLVIFRPAREKGDTTIEVTWIG